MVFQLTYMKKASLSIKYTQKVNTRLYCQRFERKKIIVLECLAEFHTNHGLNNNNRRATPTKPKTKHISGIRKLVTIFSMQLILLKNQICCDSKKPF